MIISQTNFHSQLSPSISRYKSTITWKELKESFIEFIGHYKVLKIKEERELVYISGPLQDFVKEKYERINYLYPKLDEQTKIRFVLFLPSNFQVFKNSQNLITSPNRFQN